jgi:hypothetical protein
MSAAYRLSVAEATAIAEKADAKPPVAGRQEETLRLSQQSRNKRKRKDYGLERLSARAGLRVNFSNSGASLSIGHRGIW